MPAPPEVESEGASGDWVFDPAQDEPRRRKLSMSPIQSVKLGRGGRSLAFKIELADGTRGYFKPEQSFSGAHWYAELASYYLDRELDVFRVSPSIGRRVSWQVLKRAAHGTRRRGEMIIEPEGTVRGAFIWWIPEELVPLRPGKSWERWIRNSALHRRSPYQRAAHIRDPSLAPPVTGRSKQPDVHTRPEELSDMIAFDFLTHNIDRWGGKFTNVRTRTRGGPLVYLDNGAGFPPSHLQRTHLMDSRIEALQRFRRSTVTRIRRFQMNSYRERLAEDPLAPLLSEVQLEGVERRRHYLLSHVQRMEARFGDHAFFEEH
ncbi:MAG: hypothetical protein AAF355_12240 [Myxococcota bacterium]